MGSSNITNLILKVCVRNVINITYFNLIVKREKNNISGKKKKNCS